MSPVIAPTGSSAGERTVRARVSASTVKIAPKMETPIVPPIDRNSVAPDVAEYVPTGQSAQLVPES